METKKIKKKKRSDFQKREDIAGLLLISPIIIKCIIFVFIPCLFCLVVSFTDYNIIGNGFNFEKIGFHNYAEVFTSPVFWKSVWNTVYMLLSLPIRLIIGFLLAVAFNSKAVKGRTIFRVIYYMPAVSSVVAIGVVWKWAFNTDYGMINQIFGTSINWLGDPDVVKNSLIIKQVWGGVGAAMLMYLAGMQNINGELYEAAAIDGATPFQSMIRITLPLLGPFTSYQVITGLIAGLNSFGDNYVIVSSADSNTVIYWIYRQFMGGDYGLVGAASMVVGIIIFVLSLPNFKRMVKAN